MIESEGLHGWCSLGGGAEVTVPAFSPWGRGLLMGSVQIAPEWYFVSHAYLPLT